MNPEPCLALGWQFRCATSTPVMPSIELDNVLSCLFGWSSAAEFKAIMRLFGRFDMLTNERVQGNMYRWRTRVKHTLSTLHGMVMAVGGAWKGGAGKNHLLLSVPRKKRAWFSGLWANASDLTCCET